MKKSAKIFLIAIAIAILVLVVVQICTYGEKMSQIWDIEGDIKYLEKKIKTEDFMAKKIDRISNDDFLKEVVGLDLYTDIKANEIAGYRYRPVEGGAKTVFNIRVLGVDEVVEYLNENLPANCREFSVRSHGASYQLLCVSKKDIDRKRVVAEDKRFFITTSGALFGESANWCHEVNLED